MARVLMAGSEAAPFAKTGGLADVLGSLPAALARSGEDVSVVLPRYGDIPLDSVSRAYDGVTVLLPAGLFTCTVWRADLNGVAYYFVDCPELFDRPGLYGENKVDFPDNDVRFAVFCRAVLVLARSLLRPEILHCHDWQTGLAPVYHRELFSADPTLLGMRTVLTIHNLGYQGLFPPESLISAGLDRRLFTPGYLEFFGQANYLKAGLVASDVLTTVSPTYAKEIQTPALGFGLDGLLRERSDDLYGILNGVDYDQWDPEVDSLIPANYSTDSLAGKRICKGELLRELGLPAPSGRQPVIGIVSRFVNQKGFDLIADMAADLIAESLYLVVLGSGEPRYERLFSDLAAAHPGKVAARISYDDALAHRIEAGADVFLMPSAYEPCGLNQIYSLRYGTVPVVRATGGLDDTIDEDTGFKFSEYSGRALMQAVRKALALYQDEEAWTGMMRRGMSKDFSWDSSAAQYSRLYHRLISETA